MVALLAFIVIVALFCSWISGEYSQLVESACRPFEDAKRGRDCSDSEQDQLCRDCVGIGQALPRRPSHTNAVYFAVQTMTTTGYGTGIFLSVEDIQQETIAGMLIGSCLWSLLTAAFFSLISAIWMKPPPSPQAPPSPPLV